MKVTTKTPEADAAAVVVVDAAAEIKFLTPSMKSAFSADAEADKSKVSLCAKLLERLAANPGVDKAAWNAVVSGAIAAVAIVTSTDAKGNTTSSPAKLADVTNSPDNKGNRHLYGFRSELMRVCFPVKEEFVPKVAKAIEEGKGFETVKFYARTGTPKGKKKAAAAPGPYTAEAFMNDLLALIKKAELAPLSEQTIAENLKAVQAAYAQQVKEAKAAAAA